MKVGIALDDVALPIEKVDEYVASGRSENGVIESVMDVLMVLITSQMVQYVFRGR